MIKNVALCPNVGRDKGLEITLKVDGILRDMGVDTTICPLFEHGEKGELPSGIKTLHIEEAVATADLLISFGGDGTILWAARAAAERGVPVLGINCGDKGFIAELEQSEIERVKSVVEGDYSIAKRIMLEAELERGGEIIASNFVLNDTVISGMAKIVDITVYGDGKKMTSFVGDGVVVATPMGSTAYSMSAGGPIVEPWAENIIITPICSHVLVAKSFVLAADREITIEVGHFKSNPAYLTVDGGEYLPVERGDIVHIRRSKMITRFVHFGDKSFYTKVNDKLRGMA